MVGDPAPYLEAVTLVDSWRGFGPPPMNVAVQAGSRMRCVVLVLSPATFSAFCSGYGVGGHADGEYKLSAVHARNGHLCDLHVVTQSGQESEAAAPWHGFQERAARKLPGIAVAEVLPVERCERVGAPPADAGVAHNQFSNVIVASLLLIFDNVTFFG
jgi:hypothetical protein